MLIGIDANCLSDPHRAGIGRYTSSLTEALLALDEPSLQLALFSALPIDSALKSRWEPSNRIIFCEGRFPSRYLWQQSFQSLQVRTAKPDVYLGVDGLLPYSLPCPAVCVVHDLMWHHQPHTVGAFIAAIYRLRFKPSCKKAQHIITVSQATRRDLMQHLEMSPHKVSTVYSGIDRRHFVQLDPEKTEQQLAEIGIEAGSYFLFLGNLKPHKNLKTLIAAFRKMLDQIPAGDKRPRLVLTGIAQGREPQQILQQVNLQQIQQEVLTLGYQPQHMLTALYNGAVAAVLPSTIEGFGFPVLEAQACGTPVLCSNVYSLPEVAGDAAIQVPPLDIDAMAAEMARLWNDQNLRQSLIQKGFENCKRFDWQQTAEKTLEILGQAATDRTA